MSIARKDRYNIGFFVYKDSSAVEPFLTKWFLYYKKEVIKIMPLGLSPEDMRIRNAFILKLSGLPLVLFLERFINFCNKFKSQVYSCSSYG